MTDNINQKAINGKGKILNPIPSIKQVSTHSC